MLILFCKLKTGKMDEQIIIRNANNKKVRDEFLMSKRSVLTLY